MKRLLFFLLALGCAGLLPARYVLLPMDQVQTDHLRAYGYVYSLLEKGTEVNWLLNHRGGSFLFQEANSGEPEGVGDNLLEEAIFFEYLRDESAAELMGQVLKDPMQEAVVLDRAPRIAVYGPLVDDGEWDDAVANVLSYAGIPFTKIFDSEVLDGGLKNFDWLHVHHEDFTGQFGKFERHFAEEDWYQNMVGSMKTTAAHYGFSSVREMKIDIALRIKSFMKHGGCFFAMCSAADTYDISLSARKFDFVDEMYDGTPGDREYEGKLDFSETVAFKDFMLIVNPLVNEFSNIDANFGRRVQIHEDFFALHQFPATEQPQLAMLCQNHTQQIKGFAGQTTAFRTSLLKEGVDVLADFKEKGESRYIHGNLGHGSWAFLGGHDPEDYHHFIGEAAPNINKHRNSPGYRLILNNVLFPSARINQEAGLHVHEVEVYPNPNQGRFELRVESSLQQELDVHVYDVLHHELFSGTLKARVGYSALPIDLGSVVKGIYFLELRNGDFAVKRKVVVL
ncbi:MAG: T9SS type A sorting domain-containing protein [Bacteroidota bacterium]